MRCAVEVAPMRAEPSDDAEQVTQLLRGEPVRVEEQRDGWVRVVTAYDYPGWVPASALEDGEGSLPADGPEPLEAARAFLGSPYEWGGMTAAGIDCSGLVHMAYRASGRIVPRDSWQQEAAGTFVAPGLRGSRRRRRLRWGGACGPRRVLARRRPDPACDQSRRPGGARRSRARGARRAAPRRDSPDSWLAG